MYRSFDQGQITILGKSFRTKKIFNPP